ncbi:4-hydroxybenzoate polyprenyl transferase [Suhomyces tanzawaensis NRRL Y-17324]|uniref:4-hydroxybenzoate polyprenyltransferase, mitochondrial n=1 Tax=Suhomyces tanzawaensis NRRL Y-17324 TaxID=984487 RepID=A0A1E4SJ84_9ASCO|nr:4-hydroxybenzoate polyprenyl transferase [Suhomyces tanzawaensis NRRL Y-17324]ODV79550.1 4-hydroxybenzoate polyprenyl transferase [Suhomyces tanzawaensis NRRL Y-17324]
MIALAATRLAVKRVGHGYIGRSALGIPSKSCFQLSSLVLGAKYFSVTQPHRTSTKPSQKESKSTIDSQADPHTATTSVKQVFSQQELEAARLARLAGLGWLAKLPEKWIPYAELMRLEKPVGTLLLLTPSLWGITMAAYSIAAPVTTFLSVVGLFSVGALIMRGAGCTINDILDRNLDNKVARTIERPVASGRVSVPQAVGFLGVQCFAGLAVLLSLPFECFYLGAAAIPLIFLYPLFKRYTYYPQFWFSLCFSWACLLGWPAVGAPLDLWVALPLALSNWFWGIIYDTVYAHQDKKFDINAGIKSSALAWGDRSKPILNRFLAGQAISFSIAGALNGMGPGFYIMGTVAMVRLYQQLKKVDLDSPKDCWNFFTSNIKNGFILWFGMVIDYALKLSGFL